MTSWPRSAAIAAAFSPAGPPPTTMTFFGRSARRLMPYSRSRPVSGCWMQEIGNPRWKWPMQAWLQPMQARMSSV